MTLVVALILLVGTGAAGLLLPLPYLVAAPGVTVNTVGELRGEPVITVEGAESYEHDDGALSMVTVQYAGGPDHRLNFFTLVTAWLSPTQAVLPEELLFPAGRSPEEVSERQTVQMNDSQTDATAAALSQLGIAYDAVPQVADTVEDMPAHGVVETGDVIVAVDGRTVPTTASGDEELVGSAAVVEWVSSREPGEPVELTLDRDGETVDVEMETHQGDNGAAVGVLIADDMDFPVEVEISVGDIGGPSAGMMFSLGIMDRLTEESLTGGANVAGSGTITSAGQIGGISGIPQKMVSARRDGADYFLVAAESCSQVFQSAAYDELDVVRVETLTDAVDALETIRTGEGELPRCQE
ncbi:PDZ domain-containing protein [Nocardiopsis sp. NRRL B-16309]|uniref:YlbL family protein n=1 Tax=Nocardiopsis sp. NRRL B-16309 TaxID=1519494 RepID=UPI0006ADB146|nr:S16 family serine protease [Nocardiopsis sp. NRRL B-16309]KOX12189.1 PDZ/DHR/GLGF domain-containing protein [Nocardiopsis sp. NRRL B-16309]